MPREKLFSSGNLDESHKMRILSILEFSNHPNFEWEVSGIKFCTKLFKSTF